MRGDDLRVTTVDYHTAGEPFRIVTGGVPPLAGETILEKRRFAAERLDDVRRCSSTSRAGTRTCTAASSPSRRTGAPTSASSSFTTPGYSTACGHGTIALVTWALETGGSQRSEPETARGRGRPFRAARDGRAVRDGGACARCASATCPPTSRPRALEAGRGCRSTSRSAAPSTRRSTRRSRCAGEPAALSSSGGRSSATSRRSGTSSTRASPSSATSTASSSGSRVGRPAAPRSGT